MNEQKMKRRLYFSVILIGFSILMLAIPVKKEDSTQKQLKVNLTSENISVEEIVDGDTFLLSNNEKVRLIGVDTPEKGQFYYNEAIAYAESLLLGKHVNIELDNETEDRYGRKLAYLFCDSIFYNKEVLEKGLAVLYLFENNQKYKSKFINAQKSARNMNLGIWSLPDPPAEDFYVNTVNSNRFHRPLCISIRKTNLSKSEIFHTRDEALDKA